MNSYDAECIVAFVDRMAAATVSAIGDFTGEPVERIKADFLKAIVREGTPGSGVCICQHNPDSFRRMWGDTPEQLAEAKGNMILDHRCPDHGEKAQPALWGRHKEKQLGVSWKEWQSLGVEYRTK